jgi:outer membrane protein insertion porin family
MTPTTRRPSLERRTREHGRLKSGLCLGLVALIHVAAATAWAQPSGETEAEDEESAPTPPATPPENGDGEEDEEEAPAAPPSAEATPRTICHGRVIGQISVEGAQRVDPNDVVGAIRLRRGAVCSDEDVTRDARTLWRLDLFDDIQVRAARRGNVVDLTIVVRERPAIGTIVYQGNDEVSDDDLDEEVDLTEGDIVDLEEVREALEKVRDKYAEEGYFLAQVRYELRPVGDDGAEVEVVFIIDEGEEVAVRSIRFVGNHEVSSSDLRGAMETSQLGFFSRIFSGASFSNETFENDVTAIQAYYYDQGYLAVAVGTPRVELSPDRRYIDITIPVDEGPRFRVGRIEVAEVDSEGTEVETLLPIEELRDGVGVESGDWFSRTQIAEGLQNLTRNYRDEGYAYASLEPETEVDSERRIVDINVNIERGPIVYIERINITGNTKTRDRVIRREMMLLEGMRYHQSLLERSRMNIMALSYFERVDFSQEEGSAPDRIIINVEVAERATGTFQVGAGFSSLEQFVLQAQINQQNLFGRGQSLSLQLQVSAIRQNIQLSFYEPWFLQTQWGLSVDLTKNNSQNAAFRTNQTSAGIALGHPIYDRRLRFSFGYRIEYSDIGASNRNFAGVSQAQAFNAFQQSSLSNRFAAGITSSVRLSLSWDSRDNRMSPTNGLYSSYSAQIADPILGSDNTFVQQDFFFRFYKRVFGPVILRGNFEVGLITSRSDRGVPIYKRYYLGGIYSVRGYDYYSLGPTALISRSVNPDADPGTRGITLGGNVQAFYQLEAEFIILESAGIRGVIFTDGGNAWNLERNIREAPDSDDIAYSVVNFNPLQIRTSVGFGFRWISPMGPLRFEWGIPLNRRSGEGPVEFQFTIGNSF